MKYAVIDTETSGLFDFKAAADAPHQPRLAHFCSVLVDQDLQEIQRHEFFARPDGWVMPEETSKINGLTTEMLIEKGVPIAQILDHYTETVLAGTVIVAFNAQFDCKMMRSELRRAGRPDLFEQTPNICVMRPMTDICKVPKTGRAAHFPGYSFPKLSKALEHIGLVNRDAHRAMGDALDALEVFRWLTKEGKCPVAQVHYAAGGKPVPRP